MLHLLDLARYGHFDPLIRCLDGALYPPVQFPVVLGKFLVGTPKMRYNGAVDDVFLKTTLGVRCG